MNFQVGDILMVRGDSFLVSPVIKHVLGSEYSHVAIAVGKNHICEIDAFKKMRIVPNPYTNYDVLRLKEPLSKIERSQMQRFLLNKLDTVLGYDWLRIIEILVRKYLKWEVELNAKNRFICSEIVGAAYAEVGIDLLPDHQPEDITPFDLLLSDKLEFVDTELAKSV